MSSTSDRVPCKKCGAMILPATAKHTGGYCASCRSVSASRLVHEDYFDVAVRQTVENGADLVKTLIRLYQEPINTVRNCYAYMQQPAIEGDCPRLWKDLEATDKLGIKFCRVCRRKVFLYADFPEALAHAKQGNYVALRGPNRHLDFTIFVGKDPMSPEYRAIFNRNAADVRRSKGLQSLHISDRCCPKCHFPCSPWEEYCGECHHFIGREKKS